MSTIQTIFLDLLPTYVPFLIQATKSTGAAEDPTVDNLIVYEDAGSSSSFGTTSVTSSPLDPVKINSKTGLWGAKLAKSELTAGKYYFLLWEMTVDSVTTAKVECYFVTNSSSFKADVSGLSTFDPATDTVDIGKVNGSAVTGANDFKADVSGVSTFDASTDSVDIGKVNGSAVTGVSDFKADVSSLSTSAEITALESHGDTNWITATGFSTFDPDTDTVDIGAVNGTPVTGPADLKASGFSTHAAADVVSAMQVVAADFKADVSSLSTSAEITALEAHGDTNWITATGFSTFDPDTDTVDVSAINGTPVTGPADLKASGFSTHAAADVVSAMQVVAADFKADVLWACRCVRSNRHQNYRRKTRYRHRD